ncbi:MAG: hypothetical protein HY273_03475 [Gammaproteobacteria bacterium]|nr:hypothetical protein [Gammaproteobacteria bacterium]
MFFTLFGMSVLLPLMSAHAAAKFDITPAVQAAMDKQKMLVATWASNPVIVNATKAQNAKGPIAGMDNPKWKTTRRSDPLIAEFQSNEAAVFLKAKLEGSQSLYSEAFLSAAAGEKVAFVEKTSSYIHKGVPKFDVPFTTGAAWQGAPEFDESSQTYAIQISVPVNAEGKALGVLVVGVSLSQLEKSIK